MVSRLKPRSTGVFPGYEPTQCMAAADGYAAGYIDRRHRVEQRRLADTRFALNEDRTRARPDSLKEILDLRKLRRASWYDSPDAGMRHIRILAPRVHSGLGCWLERGGIRCQPESKLATST